MQAHVLCLHDLSSICPQLERICANCKRCGKFGKVLIKLGQRMVCTLKMENFKFFSSLQSWSFLYVNVTKYLLFFLWITLRTAVVPVANFTSNNFGRKKICYPPANAHPTKLLCGHNPRARDFHAKY